MTATKRTSKPRHQGVRDFAYVEVASSELTRDINRDLVLERIRALQPIARVDLARETGLQPSTVSSIVEQLVAERWVREGAVVKTARGRRPTMLSLNDNLAFLVADVRPVQAVVAAIDLNGLFISRLMVPMGSSPQRSVQDLVAAMMQLRGEHPGRSFVGVGISLPGRVDPQTNRLVLAPNLGWEDYGIREDIAKKLRLRTEMDNAANACLLSELWFGRLDQVRNAVLVTVSEGIGTALLTEGRLMSGRHGLAGEFGHVVMDPAGPVCGCGQHGCWEMYASSRAALRYYAELEPDAPKMTIRELVSLAMDGNRAALKALERQALAVGRGLRMLNAGLAPEVILFAGDITNFWNMSHATIEAECVRGLAAGSGPKIISLGDGEMARLRGAAALVLQRHTGYYRAAFGKPVRDAERKATNANSRG